MRYAVNRVGALLLLIPALPVIAAWYVVLKTKGKNDSPFLYRGERMGKNKEPFRIYKIRTLVDQAEALIGGHALLPGSILEIPFGRFLRDTRMDELPQVFNVLKGDIDLVGPRPERRAISESCEATIPDYAVRFRVRPGLTGYSQLFTAHEAPKRIRSLIDNHFVHRQCNLFWDIGFVALTAYAIARRIARDTLQASRDAVRTYRARGNTRDLCRLRRAGGNGFRVFVHSHGFRRNAQDLCEIRDINYYALRIAADREFKQDDCVHVTLVSEGGRRKKTRRPKLHGFVHAIRPNGNHSGTCREYVIFYTAASDLHRYLVDQYVLDEALL